MAGRDTSLNNNNDPNQANGPQVGMHTLEKNIVCKVRTEVDSVITTVETTVQDAVLTSIESFIIPRIELAMKSVNASSGHGVGSVMLDPLEEYFSGNIEGLQMTSSSRINSHIYLNGIDETRGNITVEEGDLLVNERNFERHTHTHSSQCRLATISATKLSWWSRYS